jgi:hypothetical protein
MLNPTFHEMNQKSDSEKNSTTAIQRYLTDILHWLLVQLPKIAVQQHVITVSTVLYPLQANAI